MEYLECCAKADTDRKIARTVWYPLIFEYDNYSGKLFNPNYPQLYKVAFRNNLKEKAKKYSSLNAVKGIYETFSYTNETLLMIAAYTNDFDLVDFLLSLNVDINQRPLPPANFNWYQTSAIAIFHGETALHYAARGGNKEMYEHLIKHGADENIVSKQGDTAMDVWLRKSLFLKYFEQ